MKIKLRIQGFRHIWLVAPVLTDVGVEHSHARARHSADSCEPFFRRLPALNVLPFRISFLKLCMHMVSFCMVYFGILLDLHRKMLVSVIFNIYIPEI